MDHERPHERLGIRVMGTDAEIVVVRGPAGLAGHAAEHLATLETRWSRFLPDSEISRLNAAAGHPVVVSPGTFELVRQAILAWRRTDGAYDPTVLHALVAAGYDRDFASVAADDDAPADAPTQPPPGAGVVDLDPVVGAIRLPPGVGIDVGGIAKGYAADLVVQELLEHGAEGACVNIGGDLRVGGSPPSGDAWAIEIEREPGARYGCDEPEVLVLATGGVATTSRQRRVWRRDGEERHHVIDPRSGRPARTRWSSVTVVAGSACAAEPAATAAFLADDLDTAARRAGALGAVGLAYDVDGRRHAIGDVAPFLASAAIGSFRSLGTRLAGTWEPAS